MVKHKLLPLCLATAYLVVFFAVRSFKTDEINYQAGGRTLLQFQDDENETECTAEENPVGLPYNYFIYCMVGNEAGAMVILVIWWLLLFTGLATCADEYFCPALVVISEGLGLTPNVAGVTLLALGNGAPDFFAAFSALSGSTTGSQMGIGAIFGAAIFVTTILIGVIGAIKPFKASERPFLRDIIFYIGAVYWGFYMLWRKKVYMWECIGFIILYIFYVVVVIVSSYVYKKHKESQSAINEAKLTKIKQLNENAFQNKGYIDDTTSAVTSAISLDVKSTVASLPPKIEISEDEYETTMGATRGEKPIATLSNHIKTDDEYETPMGVTGAEKPIAALSPNHIRMEDEYETTKGALGDEKHIRMGTGLSICEDMDKKSDILAMPHQDLDNLSARIENEDFEMKDDDDVSECGSEDKGDPEPSTLTLLLYGLCPVNLDLWPEMSIIGKCYAIFKSPMVFLMTLVCPVVSYDDSENHNWNRPLQTLQLFVSPSLCLFLIGLSTVTIGGVFPVVGITLIIGAVLAAINFFLTSNFPRPKYHNIFSIVGFVTALVLIYVLANEIVGFLQTFGKVSNINESILGLTFLAWGNSMGDLMANVVMARQGFPKMSFAACFGASLFNLTLGFGFSMLIKMVTAGTSEAELNFGPVELVLSAFLMFTLVVNLMGISMFQRFKITRPYGGILLFIYLVFLVIVILTGTGVILADLEL